MSTRGGSIESRGRVVSVDATSMTVDIDEVGKPGADGDVVRVTLPLTMVTPSERDLVRPAATFRIQVNALDDAVPALLQFDRLRWRRAPEAEEGVGGAPGR